MNQLRFFFGEAWEYLMRGKATSLAAGVALSSVLFLFALVLLVSHNVRQIAGEIQLRKGLTVFFADGVTEARANEMAGIFEGFGEVSGVEFVHREQALKQLENDLGGFPVASTLGENPLPHSLIIALTPESAARAGSLQGLAHEIQAYDDVEEVIYGDEWIETLDANLRLVRLAILVVGGLAALAVAVVLLTTLRLLFVGRKETLRILKVVGATDQFLRTPFLFLGAMQCLFAALFALLLLQGAKFFFDAFLPGVRALPIAWQVLFASAAAVLGVFASYLAIEPSLRRLERVDDEVVR